MNDNTPLSLQRCVPCRTGEGKLSDEQVSAYLANMQAWQRAANGNAIHSRRTFKNFAAALAWVNAVGEVAEAENHHPDIALGWGYAEITLTTHDAGGLTRNDFILAAKIDALASH